jgi:inhibitor of cysteine peptidase
MKTLTRADRDTVLALAPGESFEIRLPENPTTGYVWEVEPVPGAVAAVVREAFEQEPADPRIVGRGGTKVFVFKAGLPGEGEVVLRLRRPWQRDVSIDSFVLTVKVGAKSSAGGNVP